MAGTINVGGLDLFVSESFYSRGGPGIELSKNKIEDVNAKLAPMGNFIDAHAWLPAAAEQYKISPNLRDYVITPVPAYIADIPNTNGEAPPLEDLLRFDPEYGKQIYKTAIGQPTHEEHDNRDITKAKGVILDTYLKRVSGFGNFYKATMLLAYDRTKDPQLVESILRGDVRTYSVGYYYGSYTCSICGHVASAKSPECAHTGRGQRTRMLPEGRLAYRRCHVKRFFECSSVSNPAFIMAQSDVVIDMATGVRV